MKLSPLVLTAMKPSVPARLSEFEDALLALNRAQRRLARAGVLVPMEVTLSDPVISPTAYRKAWRGKR